MFLVHLDPLGISSLSVLFSFTKGSSWPITREDRPKLTSQSWTIRTSCTGRCVSKHIFVTKGCPNIFSKFQFHCLELPPMLSTKSTPRREKNSEDQADSAAALMHESKKGKKKGKRGPYCAPGKHNSEATSHDAEHCWQLHPEQRPNNGSKSSSYGSHPPTTQLVEVDDGHESEVSLLLTEAASKPIVLDSGATHHLINNPETFQPTSESNIKIATGGHSNFLNATAVGVATLVNHLGERIVLDNALLVPTLTRSLISIPRIFKEKLLIVKTADKGATIIVDNQYKLLGSMKNNLLELHSSHFEVIKSPSSCYQSSSDSPNWHTRLGHPNPKYHVN
ncbi:hypothetical protein VP01_2168g1 [Puccinia sorghi]|uniref:Retrovirus-related Pol polyprotein from transposon TNT 1-94-like beta-barrel domain-containing protein n=1 Tax=Puccinia sorghi TaxID=27349 RepID=A0A0L6VBC0_9BASI|nr:hypothetical protein VP01_2168g1 [Puccinia sorghi]